MACLALAFLLLVLPLTAPAQDTETLDELKESIQEILEQHRVPGAGIALVDRGGILWAGGIGKADVKAGKGVTADTHFRVGSITKSFVALALVRLSEAGKIDLNARLKEVAPEVEFHNPWESTHPVRVVHLLEHTAGFDDMHFNEMYNVKDPPDMSLQDVLSLNPRSRTVRWPPGTRMAYSNPGYAIAGYLIETITGQRFEDHIEETILAPLGMTTATFRLIESSRALLSEGYDDEDFEPVPYAHIYLRPAGSLNASARELAVFVQMLLNRGKVGSYQLVSPESLARMERPETSLAARSGSKVGYGLGIFSMLEHSMKVYGHGGGIEGFISSYAYLPDQGLGYVALLNSTVSGRALIEIRNLLFGYLTRDLGAPPRPQIKLSEAQLMEFAGHYQDAGPRNQLTAFINALLGGLTLFVEDGALYMKGSFGSKQALIPVTAHTFRLEREPEASMIFVTAEDGTKVLASGFTYFEKIDPWGSRTRLVLVVLAIVLMFSSPLAALVWGKDSGHLAIKIVPVAALLSIFAAFLIMLSTPPYELGTLNIKTGSFFVLTWVFAVLSILGLLLAIRGLFVHASRGARIRSLLVSVGNCGIALYLANWQIIGLKLWEW